MRGATWRRLLVSVLLVILALGFTARPAFGQSDTTPTLTTGGTISYEPGAGPVRLDPDLTITGTAGAVLDAAVVSFGSDFRPAEDTLGIDGQEGITGTVEDLAWSYDSNTGMITLRGEAPLANYQAALRQVTFANSSTTRLVAPRMVSISLGSAIYNPQNGHFYEFVDAPRVAWTDANAAAEAMTFADMQGYLVTVTSAAENNLVTQTVEGKGWMGASDADHDKEWYWVTGPEAGTHFFTQATDGDGCGEGRAATQPPGDNYDNWDTNAPEPNDFPAGCTDSENYGHISEGGRWNDWPDSGAGQAFGYVVEYGGVEGDPTDTHVGTILIQAAEPSITIENTWVGDDPNVDISFTVIAEVDGCSDEQTAVLPAGEASVDVVVADEVDDTACTYTVTVLEPVGYTATPDEVTAVPVKGTAAFTNEAIPVEALPRTGPANSALIILGLVLAGSGWLLLGGERRGAYDGDDNVLPVNLLPGVAWTEQAAAPPDNAVPALASGLVDADDADQAPASGSAQAEVSASAPSPDNDRPDAAPFVDVLAPSEPQLDQDDAPTAIESATDDATSTISEDAPTEIESTTADATATIPKPEAKGGYSIVEELLQLLDDLAED